MTQAPEHGQSSFAALRRFTRKRPPAESCELCSAPLSAGHEHLIESAAGRLVCSCTACAILFSGQPRRSLPPRAPGRSVPERLSPDGCAMGGPAPADQSGLLLPSTRAGRVVAVYPSPAGGTESLLTLEAWHQLEEENPVPARFRAGRGSATGQSARARARTLSCADRCLLPPRGLDPHQLAGLVGRPGSVGRNPAVFRRLEPEFDPGGDKLPCLI